MIPIVPPTGGKGTVVGTKNAVRNLHVVMVDILAVQGVGKPRPPWIDGVLFDPTNTPSPGDDVLPEPQSRSAGSKIDDRSWHVGISLLVDAYCVPMGKTQQLCDDYGIDQVFRSDGRDHASKITPVDFHVGKR